MKNFFVILGLDPGIQKVYQKQMTPLLLKKIKKGRIVFAICFLMFPYATFAGEINGLVTTPDTNSIFLEWDKTSLSETQSVTIIRKTGVCPRDISDGEGVYGGNGMSFLDKNVSPSTEYCYGVYVYDSLGMPLEMKISGLTSTISFWGYIGSLFEKNAVLTGLVALMIVLNFLNIEKKRRFYRNRKK